MVSAVFEADAALSGDAGNRVSPYSTKIPDFDQELLLDRELNVFFVCWAWLGSYIGLRASVRLGRGRRRNT